MAEKRKCKPKVKILKQTNKKTTTKKEVVSGFLFQNT